MQKLIMNTCIKTLTKIYLMKIDIMILNSLLHYILKIKYLTENDTKYKKARKEKNDTKNK